mgnify:CR=1 FL=1
MENSRTKNASRNIVFGVLQKFTSLLLPFVTRTLLIYVLGNEYLGLSSLFSSILQVLSLTELGVGTAMVYSMYKPMAENDTEKICSLLYLYRKIYRIIGVVMVVIGVVLTPFLKYLIKGDIPDDINLYILYAIYTTNSAISYFLFAYKQSLFTASQRSDIYSKLNLVTMVLMNFTQITALLLFKNYYAYIIILPFSTVATNILNAIIANKRYPQYICYGEVPQDIKKSIVKKTAALFGSKLNSIVLHAADILVISAFIGLNDVAIYGNYYYIMNSIVGIINIVYSSMTAGIGNSLIAETEEKNYYDFRKLTFINFWMITFCATCLLCMYQPFMKLWVGEELLYPTGMMCLFVIYFYLYQMRRVVLTYKDAAGIWWEDRFRPYVIMIFNLGTNLLLVQFIGVYGVIIATIISMSISIPWENYTVFKYNFKCSPRKYYMTTFVYVVVALIAMTLTYVICEAIPVFGVVELFIRLLLCFLIPNMLLFIIYHKCPEFISLVATAKQILLRKSMNNAK